MQEELFKVRTHAFEGPLELLLDLIEKRKLFINDISLSAVTDDFINYIKERENFPLGLSAQFVLIASTLLLIKSKSLLPSLDLTTEEVATIEDLEIRLKEYKRIKELSVHVRNLFGKKIIFQKLPVKQKIAIFAPDASMNILNIAETARNVLLNLPKKEIKPQITIKKIISLEETIENLTKRITKSLRMSFREFSGHSQAQGGVLTQEDKVNVIVGFLAMLELAKQGIIAISQETMFDDIHMETEVVGLPRYY